MYWNSSELISGGPKLSPENWGGEEITLLRRGRGDGRGEQGRRMREKFAGGEECIPTLSLLSSEDARSDATLPSLPVDMIMFFGAPLPSYLRVGGVELVKKTDHASITVLRTNAALVTPG